MSVLKLTRPVQKLETIQDFAAQADIIFNHQMLDSPKDQTDY